MLTKTSIFRYFYQQYLVLLTMVPRKKKFIRRPDSGAEAGRVAPKFSPQNTIPWLNPKLLAEAAKQYHTKNLFHTDMIVGIGRITTTVGRRLHLCPGSSSLLSVLPPQREVCACLSAAKRLDETREHHAYGVASTVVPR